MARGLQKAESQQKAREKANKSVGHSTLKDTGKMKGICPVCKLPMDSPQNFKQHFESKHPKDTVPDWDTVKVSVPGK